MPRTRIANFLEVSQAPFPDSPRPRADALARSLNTETKAAVMAFCLKDTRYVEEFHTTKDIRSDFLGILGKGGWEPQESVFTNYAHGSFLPSGLVSEHLVQCECFPEPVTVWAPTAAMVRYGRPIAAYTLKRSVDNQVSMSSVLGTKRAPENRLRMLELLRDGASTEAELIAEIGLGNNNIMKHMKALRGLGMIGFETGSNEDGSGWAKYRWKEGKRLSDVRPVGTVHALTRKIAGIIRENDGYMTVGEINRESGHRHPSDVSTVLRGLYRQGIIESGRWETHLRSDIWLEPGGTAFLEEWLDRVADALSDGPELACMQSALEAFEADPEMTADYVGRGVDMYRSVSLSSRRKSSEARKREIEDFVRGYQEEHGRGPRHTEIEEAIGVGVSKYLRSMEGDVLRKVKSGKAVRYQMP